MSGKCYLKAFKIKAVKQVIERGHSVSSIATRLDITTHSLYAWIKPPHSRRHHVDLNLTGYIRQFWLESGCVYGYRKICIDLRDIGNNVV